MGKAAQRKRNTHKAADTPPSAKSHMPQLSKMLKYWLPYIEKIGVENFGYNDSHMGVKVIITKHYCGYDASEALKGGEYIVNLACTRADIYADYTSRNKLTKDDIEYLFVCSICHQFYDEELLYLLSKYAKCLTDEEHWELITQYWTLQELNCNEERKETWRKVFSLRSPISHLTEELPETFIAYRGASSEGFSWSLSKETAEWFANRFSDDSDAEVQEQVFNRADALFYTNNRSEQEVVILN